MTATVDDPTMQFLADLDDPSKFVVVRNLPIMICHRRVVRDAGGEPIKTVEISPDELPEIIDMTERYRRKFGVVPIITEGHRQPWMEEAEMPDVLGYGLNLHMGVFGPRGEPCILADHYILKDCYERAKKYPFRSVDFVPERKTITGIALLKRDPHLPLGMVGYGSGLQCLMYSLEIPTMAEPNLGESLGAPPAEATPAELPLSDDDKKKAVAYLRYAMSQPDMMQYMKTCYESGFSSPNAGNVNIPAVANAGVGDDTLRMQRDSDAIRYQQNQTELTSMRQQLNTLLQERDAANKKADRADCERQITQLEALGYQLDRAAEVNDLAELPPEKRAARIERIKKHYHQNPALAYSGSIPIHAGPVEGGIPTGPPANSMTRDERDAAIKWGRKNGVDNFDEMLAGYRASQNKA